MGGRFKERNLEEAEEEDEEEEEEEKTAKELDDEIKRKKERQVMSSKIERVLHSQSDLNQILHQNEIFHSIKKFHVLSCWKNCNCHYCEVVDRQRDQGRGSGIKGSSFVAQPLNSSSDNFSFWKLLLFPSPHIAWKGYVL